MMGYKEIEEAFAGEVTPDLVTKCVKALEEITGDDEVAHSREDDLHQAVLKAIGEGRCDYPMKCALLALGTLDIEFARWCA